MPPQRMLRGHKILIHESYGTVVVTRTQSGREYPLFGSPIQHRNTIRLEIRQAEVSCRLSTDFSRLENRSRVAYHNGQAACT